MLRCHQSDCQKLNFVYFEELRTFNTSETLGYRFKMILLDQEMDLKKNPIKKYFFILEKKIVWKKKSEKIFYFFVSQKISNLEILDFSTSRHFREKIDIFDFEKKKADFFQTFFWKKLSTRKKYFFSMGFFLKSISWLRRIVFKRFRSISEKIEVHNLPEENVLTLSFYRNSGINRPDTLSG